MTDEVAPPAESRRDPYRAIVGILLVSALAGTVAALFGGLTLGNGVLLAAAACLGLGAAILFGVAAAQFVRARPAPPPPRNLAPEFAAERRARGVLEWFRELGTLDGIRLIVGVAGGIAIVGAVAHPGASAELTPFVAGMAAAGCVVATIFAAAAAHYFVASVDAAILPEAIGLAKGARVTAWISALAAVSIGLQWFHQVAVVQAMSLVVFAVDAGVCCALLMLRRAARAANRFPTDLGPLSMLGSRVNPIASVLDAAERQLGIDVRSTWAFTVIRRGLEPLVVALCLLAWLSTSLTVVGLDEQGLVERLGVPVKGDPLLPGLHVHLPWPIDDVFRVPVRRVQTIEVGHEGEEGAGPENVLWSVEHAPNEYTLLLGNGRDLITIDAAVQFRITDPRAWRYRTQNPGDALHALAYRAVMRNTVNRTLADALSENVAVLADSMRYMMQADADALGLGVTIVGFTIGGMHPPVPVASAYEGVVSAEIRKVTAIVNAQADRNRAVPGAQATAASEISQARAEAAEALARAAGDAWSFRTLEAQYRAAPQEYLFRRRLETLEHGLPGHPYTILDFRYQRDGGEVWIVP